MSKGKRMLLLVNGVSGKGLIKKNLVEVVDMYIKAGYEVRVHTTQRKDDARVMAEKEAGNYDVLVCSGGDGTLDEVTTGVMASGINIPIGYIPAGSTNDFSRSLDIPVDIQKAAKNVVKGKPFALDVGRFNKEKNFIYVAACGMLSDTSYETPQNLKNALGYLAYVISAVKSVANIKTYHMEIDCDGKKQIGDFFMGMITNASRVGGIKTPVAKDMELDDGLFEVLFIKRPRSVAELAKIAKAILTKDLNNEYMLYEMASTVKIRCTEPVKWSLDGEYGGTMKNAVVENIPKAVEIIRPAKYAK